MTDQADPGPDDQLADAHGPDTPPRAPAALFDLSGRVALVSGASRGIGWSIARALAAAGATVVLTARTAAPLEARRAQLGAWNLAAEALAFDVTDAAAARAAVDAVLARHGRLDILVANAAGTLRKPFLEQNEDDWQRVLDVALTASWRLARAAAPAMAAAGFGRILMVSSINAVVARPEIHGYVAAKAGLEGLVRALGVELAPRGITVNGLAPGYVETEENAVLRLGRPGFQEWINGRTPMGRWGRPADLETAALYLCAPASAWTTGSIVTLDGGLTAAI
jgi:gluconate 5-dehydrogenase